MALARSASSSLPIAATLALATLISLGGIALVATEGPWTIAGAIGALLSFVVAIAVLWITIDVSFFLPKRRRAAREQALNNPADVYFLVPSLDERRIDFAVQDQLDHWVEELIVPPHSTRLIEVRIAPHLDFSTYALQFGCFDNEKNKGTQKPIPTSMVRVFAKKGLNIVSSPDATPGHTITSHDFYEVAENRQWNKTVRVIGLMLEAKDTGTYRFFVYFMGPEVEASKELSIRVEAGGSEGMRCVKDDHPRHRISPL